MPTLLWLQAGACSGDSMSLLCANNPDLVEVLNNYQIELLWHPSLSPQSPEQLGHTIERINAGEQELTVLCIEGAILTGPEGTGMYDTLSGRPKMSVIEELAEKAHVVVAIGTCASFGGIPAASPNPTDATGMQFCREEHGGLLDSEWRSAAGLPVVNLPGCPVHPSTVIQALLGVLLGMPIELDGLNRPRMFYSSVVHQGCSRNEYHEFDVEEFAFGGKGCLFFNLGCQGPNTMSTCNIELWNGQNSKTRAGIPCFGCTSPLFPKEQDFFATAKIGDIPITLPLGVDRANYMAYKGLAKAATPKRLLDRKNEI
ncbi:MAG: NADH:ubiquinone oxidoreductase [Cyanobacteria bacterium NC_groundwater_1444_Ag_S-0.65um_54_12]|nr:NADH:ubiquinone oxidoreductase [Cyanobacteria bacterium NC_groundwater_1444_Ag_S-0.65um_54_12]